MKLNAKKKFIITPILTSTKHILQSSLPANLCLPNQKALSFSFAQVIQLLYCVLGCWLLLIRLLGSKLIGLLLMLFNFQFSICNLQSYKLIGTGMKNVATFFFFFPAYILWHRDFSSNFDLDITVAQPCWWSM